MPPPPPSKSGEWVEVLSLNIYFNVGEKNSANTDKDTVLQWYSVNKDLIKYEV